MTRLVGMNVHLLSDEDGEGRCYVLALEEYAKVRHALMTGAKGWVELRHAFGDGKLVCRWEDIGHVFVAPPDYCRTADEWDEQEKQRDAIERLTGQ